MPNRFPIEATLRDSRRVLIRPFTAQDTDALFSFFQHLPVSVKRCAWEHIEDRGLVESWGRNLNYDRVLPVLALDGTRVVADATLHRRGGGPLRRVGRIKWLMDPEYRGLGLGTVLVNSFISIAAASGLRHLTCMLIPDAEGDAIETLRELGFTEHVFPGYGTDPDGNAHDMVKLILPL